MQDTQAAEVRRVFLDRGYGFLRLTEERADIFFHARECVGGFFEELKEGDPVSCLVREDKRGRRYAIDVVREGG